MKKSLISLTVIFLTLLGATSLAAAMDSNVKKNIGESSDMGSGSNGTGSRNQVSKDK